MFTFQKNNLTNYLYFFNNLKKKNLNASMFLHGL